MLLSVHLKCSEASKITIMVRQKKKKKKKRSITTISQRQSLQRKQSLESINCQIGWKYLFKYAIGVLGQKSIAPLEC